MKLENNKVKYTEYSVLSPGWRDQQSKARVTDQWYKPKKKATVDGAETPRLINLLSWFAGTICIIPT